MEILRFPAIATYADWRKAEGPDMEKASLVANSKDDLLCVAPLPATVGIQPKHVMSSWWSPFHCNCQGSTRFNFPDCNVLIGIANIYNHSMPDTYLQSIFQQSISRFC